MNRNTELHFGHTPSIDIKRSKFEESHSHKTTFNVGDIIPIYVDSDILPGDTVQMDMASLIRMATPIYPIMDNLYMDTYFFFVPHRLVWEHWAEFWGENDDPWTQTTEYEIPQITAPQGGWTEGSLADYMGIPTKISGISINALPFRAYCKVWNDWFRSEVLKTNTHIYLDETTRAGKNKGTGYNYITDTELGAAPAKAAKLFDYFTSCLVEGQKGEPVKLPLGTVAPITGTISGTFNGTKLSSYYVEPYGDMIWNGSTAQATYDVQMKNTETSGSLGNQYYMVNKAYPNEKINPANLTLSTSSRPEGTISITQNLTADLSNATSATISALRTAFAVQKYLENAGLHGTRYIEYIRSVFGVTSSDARMQRAEYLGGMRNPINIDQIIQTSSTDATSPQGNTAGFSCTVNQDSLFTKSFEEHGTLLGLAVIRTEHTYQQGLNRMWTRKKWTSFYNPFFAHLSEQGVLNKELYATGSNTDEEVFGYQEAWAEYRYKKNFVTGYMRSNATGSLDVWHFADDYKTLPYLSSEWIDEPYENVDRTIAVTSQLTHQFIGDFFFKTFYTRPMPTYSVPGLIDHV